MADHQSIGLEPLFHLPITGRRNGRQGVVIGSTIVLDDDFSRVHLASMLWSLTNGYPSSRKASNSGGLRMEYLHRVVFRHYHGSIPDGFDVDHIDRDKLNNLPSNLRAVPHRINTANQAVRSKSGFKGVCFDKSRKSKPWQAQIRVNGKHFNLGYYATAREAADAFNRASLEHRPELGIVNP